MRRQLLNFLYGKCGKLNDQLKAKKIFNCKDANCNYIADRDINGARNILLRYLTNESLGMQSELSKGVESSLLQQ
jgi:transposase